MKIIILGAGQVGSSVAENLASESYDITVVDRDARPLQELRDRLDIQTITGVGSHPSVLEQAGAEDTDLLLAVTNSDEVNMVACQVAHTLFNTPARIARVRASEYLVDDRLLKPEALAVTVIISPEELVTNYVLRLLEHPGALQVMDFAGGRVQMVAVRAYYGGPLVGHELRDLRKHIPGLDARVAAIFRNGKAIIPKGTRVIEADDEVFFVAARHDIRDVMGELRRLDKPYKRIMIAGCGNIGRRLALALEKRMQVKVIDHNAERTRALSEELMHSTVLFGDVANEDLLLNENIENTDIFCAVTNDDEANILSAMLAKRLGAHKVMALINRTAYVDLVESSGIIDVAISPQQATIGTLLAQVRRGDVVVVHSLRRGAAEAIEAIAHGSPENSKVVGRPIEDIKLPKGTTIGAIVRGDQVLIAHHDTVIQSDDHIILFLVDKTRITEVEDLFAVGLTFF
jgi:trk system potassium uptake protein TrkA